jgi:acyl carrier protein
MISRGTPQEPARGDAHDTLRHHRCPCAATGFRKELMGTQTPAERELAELVVGSLNLENIKAEDVDPDAALFGGDLGLDSIDALELALAVSKHYGFSLRSDNADNKRIFSSLRALAEHIQQHRQQ